MLKPEIRVAMVHQFTVLSICVMGCAKSGPADGANVLIMGRTVERLEKARDELAAIRKVPVIVEVFVGDAGARERRSRGCCAKRLQHEDGVLDIAVANAGMGPFRRQSWRWNQRVGDQVMQTNLSGAFYTIKHSARWMAKSGGGAICTVSSIAGVRTHRFLWRLLRQQSGYRHAGSKLC